MATYGYCRVSTDKQATDGESLPVQRRQLDGYAMQHGITIDHVFVERAVSGSKPIGERKEGAKLMAALQPGDAVLVTKLDRAFRSASDALAVFDDLKARKVSLHLLDLGGDVTGNGVSQLVFQIMSAIAQFERTRTRERIAEVKRDQRASGLYLGGTVPFGFTVGDDGELVPEPKQQRAIKRMAEMRAAGLSLRAIAEEMTAKGHRLSHEGVRKIIALPKANSAATVGGSFEGTKR
jgi:putative DNA-invertase from lambdoid prophage Rac